MADGGLSIANNLLANTAALNLSRSQARLKGAITQLSSGLRINTAADDPSGLAIASSLEAQVAGFDAGTRNVQDANNSARVAEGALQTETDILQRMRTLAVQASSDLTSTADRANLQVEVAQLILEINRISENTQFNGVNLLDGSHAGFVADEPASLRVTANAALASAGNGSVPNAGFLLASVTAFTPVQAGLRTNSIAAIGTGLQTVAVPSTANISAGSVLHVDIGGANTENVTVLAVNGNTFTAVFTKAHGANTFITTEEGLGLTTAVSTTGVQTVTLTSNQFPLVGDELIIDSGTAQQETVTVQSANGLNITADFAKTHAAGAGVSNNSIFGLIVPAVVPGRQTVALAAPQPNLSVGQQLYVADGSTPPNSEVVYVEAVGPGANSFTATFKNSHSPTGSLIDANIGGPVRPVDGTVQVQVINTGVSIAAQVIFIDSDTHTVQVSSELYRPYAQRTVFDGVRLNFGAFATADTGVTSFVKVSQEAVALSDPSKAALNIHSGSQEGSTIQVGFAATNALTLRVSNINLLVSASGAPSLSAEDAIGQIDNALERLLAQRAQFGAIIVRLNEDAGNNAIASANLTASKSAVLDADVGKQAVELTRDQILVQVGTQVLAQANGNTQSVSALFR